MTYDEFIQHQALQAMARTREKYAGKGAMEFIAPVWAVRSCKSYREVCRLSWKLRRQSNFTQAALADAIGRPASHVSAYLTGDDAPGSRDLPAGAIALFERALGNTAVTQWLAFTGELTLVEEIRWIAENAELQPKLLVSRV